MRTVGVHFILSIFRDVQAKTARPTQASAAGNGFRRSSPQHYSFAATFLSFQHFWAMMTKAEKPACIHRGDALNSGPGNSLAWCLRKDGRARQISEGRFIASLERADDQGRVSDPC